MGRPLRTKKISSFYYKTTWARLQLLLWWYYKRFMFQYFPHLYLLPLHFHAQPTTFDFVFDRLFEHLVQLTELLVRIFKLSLLSGSHFHDPQDQIPWFYQAISRHCVDDWRWQHWLIDAIFSWTRATSNSKQGNNQRTDESACADIDDGYFRVATQKAAPCLVSTASVCTESYNYFHLFILV